MSLDGDTTVDESCRELSPVSQSLQCLSAFKDDWNEVQKRT